MQKFLLYITSNQSKIRTAKRYLEPEGIEVLGKHLEMIEIQSHSGEEIIRHKAEQAFAVFKTPLIVSDHFWNIPALGGFPGAYMKHINGWFTPQDFINVMKPYANRTVYLQEHVCFIDSGFQKFFYTAIKGKVLSEIKGEKKDAFRSIISLRKDGKSIAQCRKEGTDAVDSHELWKDVADWMKKR